MLLKYFFIALLLMKQKPVRSLLSMLGIYIGMLALAVILSMHEGTRREIEDAYATQGAEVYVIMTQFDPATQKMGQLSWSDLNLLKALPGVQSVQAHLSASKKIRGTQEAIDGNFIAADDSFFSIYRIPLKAGRSFMPYEVKASQPVVVLAEAAANKLFPLSNPVGRLVNIDGKTFEVIGIAPWDSKFNARSRIADEPAGFLPPGWFRDSEGQDALSAVEVRADPGVDEDQVIGRLKTAVTRGEASRGGLYAVQSLREQIKAELEFSKQILATLLAIAAISLLVGGIGVANVMLTSVTERTREIGIRKALGAKRKDILWQFLVESCLLSATGGIAAIVTAGLGIQVASSMHILKIPMAIPVPPVLGCLLITMLIGLVAGLYPASRAATRSPADALRYE